jgi:hypothetical protein
MGDLIQRPRFFEGQVLASTDLTATIDYARGEQARHDRLVHEWGIVDGLQLIATAQGGFVTVRVSAGLAIDGTGREIVVPNDQILDEKLFARSNVAVGDPTALYPVLLAGVDAAGLPVAATRSCTAAQASRTVETWKLAFGAPGDETKLAGTQTSPHVEQGAGGAVDQPRWWIVLGFVAWDPIQQRFTSISERANDVGRRYVGVRADEVTGQGGRLVLRARMAATKGAPIATLAQTPAGGALTLALDNGTGGTVPKVVATTDGTLESDTGKLVLRAGAANMIGKPMARLDETAAGGTFAFGLQDASGNSSRLLEVDEQGNLTIAGIFRGLFGGAVRLASGTATDGVILPLPDGITDAQVASGAVALHIMVIPRAPGAAPYDADLVHYPYWVGHASSAGVDALRRVFCKIQWLGFHSGGGAPHHEVLAGAVDYLVAAVVK